MADNSHIGLGRQVALERKISILANNVANISTTYRDLSQGAIKPTYNELDFSIQGDGYFAVQAPDGIRYTRNGSFSLDGAGGLVTREGYSVLDDNGNPLTVPPGATRITAAADGTLSTDQGTLGKLKLAMFDNQQSLTPTGNSFYDAGTQTEKTIDNPKVMQGMLESSNVNATRELIEITQVSEAYKATQNQQTSDHQRAESMIQILTGLKT